MNRGIIAAFVHQFVFSNIPQKFHLDIPKLIDSWQADLNQSVSHLFVSIVGIASLTGRVDTEALACRIALAENPGHPFFAFRLIQMFKRSGNKEAAIRWLRRVRTGTLLDIDIMLELIAALGPEDPDFPSVIAHLDEALKAAPVWQDSRHNKYLSALLEAGKKGAAEAFFDACHQRWSTAAEPDWQVGRARMLLGHFQDARDLYRALWPSLDSGREKYFGTYLGNISPFSENDSERLAQKIKTAFEKEPNPIAFPVTAAQKITTQRPVLLIGAPDSRLPNDMFTHFSESAKIAGVDLRLYADSALVSPLNFVGPPDALDQRLKMLARTLEETRPAVVMLDCLVPVIQAGLNPSIMAGLMRQFDFRLVCLVRDAHRENIASMLSWLPLCDTMLVFDPRSPIFGSDFAPFRPKIECIPVPANHSGFLERPDRDIGLLFVGAVNSWPRLALLSVLLCEDINLTAIIGDERYRKSANAASYANLFARAKAVLNISRHGPDIHLITGRVWEAIAAGALLVEQANPATEMYFTPYRHYLPWTDVQDIAHIANFIDARPDLCRKVALEGHEWSMRHFGAQAIWRKILHSALRPRAERDRRAAIDAADNWAPAFTAEQVIGIQQLYKLTF